MTSILRRPSIPQVLKEAAARRTLIPFVGAGASKLAGCPSWKEFADDALQDLIEAGHFKYGQVEQIKDLGPRTKLSIACAIERQTGATINFRGLLHRTPLEKHSDGNRLYRAILALSNVVVTTNYDCWLDQTARLPTPTGPQVIPDELWVGYAGRRARLRDRGVLENSRRARALRQRVAGVPRWRCAVLRHADC